MNPASADAFSGTPQAYFHAPREEPTCRLCAALDDLSVLVHQLERETTLVADLILLLEYLVRAVFSLVAYPAQAAAARSRRG